MSTSNIGQGGVNQGFMFIELEAARRSATRSGQSSRAFGAQASTCRASRPCFQPVQNINLNSGRQSRAQYQYTLQSADLQALYAAAPDMRRRMSQLGSVAGREHRPATVQSAGRWSNSIATRAANLGVHVRPATPDALQRLRLAAGLDNLHAANDYQVIMEADRAFQTDPAALSRIFVRSNNGPERAAGRRGDHQAHRRPALSQPPGAAARRDDLVQSSRRAISLGEAVSTRSSDVEREAGLPASITTGFAGSAQLFQDALKGQGLLIMAAVLVIYIVLGVLYESFIHPITILSGLPSAGLGALLALQYYKIDLSVIAIIGILLLIGIVKKNAIMMVDFALERRREGADAKTAIREAALLRFRPIIMTTFAALLGTLPIALGHGAGSELRQPLGIAVVGGLMVSQLLTLTSRRWSTSTSTR